MPFFYYNKLHTILYISEQLSNVLAYRLSKIKSNQILDYVITNIAYLTSDYLQRYNVLM